MGLGDLLQRAERRVSGKMTRVPLDRFLREQASPRRTLDLGAGGGPYAACFPNRVSLDIEPAPGVAVIGDAHALPFAGAAFEQVVCTEVLEHLLEPARATDEMWRVLAPGGRLVLTTRFLFPIHDGPSDYFRFTRYGLEHLLRRFEGVTITEEAGPVDTLAFLVQRLGIQADTLGWRPFRYVWLVLARLTRLCGFLVTREYITSRGWKTRREGRMMTSGYYVVATKGGARS
jgi:SAM-dependent methyltransferase